MAASGPPSRCCQPQPVHRRALARLRTIRSVMHRGGSSVTRDVLFGAIALRCR